MTQIGAATTLMESLPVIVVSSIFNDNATATELLLLVACIAVFWAVFFLLFGMMVRPFIRGKTWMAAAASRDYDRGAKELYESLGNPVTREEYTERFENQWPWMQGVLLQHCLGGALCIPAVLKWGPKDQRDSLACLSILSELGWEVEDAITWIYKRWFSEGGKIKVPLGLVIAIGLHHSLTMSLGLPMVLNYRSNPYLHWLTFDLQFAGFVGLFVAEYTKFLDVSDSFQLRQFQVLSGFSLLVVIWTRGFHWVYLCSRLIMTWYEEKAWTFLVVGALSVITFSIFNWMVIITPTYNRFMKFIKISHEYKSLPQNADPKLRRASLVRLQEAAANVMIDQEDINAELVELLQRNTRTANKSNRRDTVPPSMFGSNSSLGRRRASAVLLRSSTGNISVALHQLQMAMPLDED